MKFSDLNFNPHPVGDGVQAKHFFDNGYGVSVVRFRGMFGGGSYGFDEGLYELAVLKGNKDDWSICYDTPVTDDVLGHLTEEEVEVALYEVKNLIY